MSAPYWKLRAKTQDAIASMIKAIDDPGVPVLRAYALESSGSIGEPYVLVRAQSMRKAEDGIYHNQTAARMVAVTITIRTAAESVVIAGQTLDAYEAHNNIVARIQDMLHRDDIVDLMNHQQIEDLYIQAVDETSESQDTQDNSIETEIELEIIAYPSGA